MQLRTLLAASTVTLISTLALAPTATATPATARTPESSVASGTLCSDLEKAPEIHNALALVNAGLAAVPKLPAVEQRLCASLPTS